MTNKNISVLAGILFMLAAAVTAFGKAQDFGMATVWLAIGITFVFFINSKPNDSPRK